MEHSNQQTYKAHSPCRRSLELHFRDKFAFVTSVQKHSAQEVFKSQPWQLELKIRPLILQLSWWPWIGWLLSWGRSLAATSSVLVAWCIACIKIKAPTCIETRHPPAARPKHFNLSWSDHASPLCPVNLVLLDFCLSVVSHRPSSCSSSRARARTCAWVHDKRTKVQRSHLSASNHTGSISWLMTMLKSYASRVSVIASLQYLSFLGFRY